MTLELWSDEWNVPATWELRRKPDGPVDVDLSAAAAVWSPMTVEAVTGGDGEPVTPARWLATVLVCGPDVDPVPVGNVRVTTDVLPRLRCGGQITTDQDVKVRAR